MKAKNERSREPRACAPTAGPLRILDCNPIYFTADGETPLVLSGAHTWANLQDFGGDSPVFDFDSYLDLLARHGLNFIRLWTWPGPFNCCMAGLEPYPWRRAAEDEAQFDLRQFNPEFFARLKERVGRAGDRGIYVSVMLFQWHCCWDLYPFNPANNRSRCTSGLTSMDDFLSLANPEVVDLEELYVRQFVDTLNELDNLLWEIGNEIPAECRAWEKNFVDFVKSLESGLAKQHLVAVNTGADSSGLTLEGLIATGADVVSLPSNSDSCYHPRAATRLPILADTDHINYPLNTDQCTVKVDWAWKSLTRGLHPSDMEALQVALPGVNHSPNWNNLENPAFPAAQQVTGTILRLSRQLPLATMTPQSDGYVLANAPDGEPFFVAYQPNGDRPLNLDLSAAGGTLWYQFLEPLTGTATGEPQSVAGGERVQFGPPDPPFAGAWALVLSDRCPPIQPISPPDPPRAPG